MGRRLVSVGLELDARDYLDESGKVVVASKTSKAAIKDLGDEVDKTGHDLDQLAVESDLARREVKDLGDVATKTGHDLDEIGVTAAVAKHEINGLGDKAAEAAAQVKLLDARIKDAKASVGDLAVQFSRSGGLADKQNLNDAKRALATLEKTRRDILAFAASSPAEQAAEQTAAAVSDTVSKGFLSGLKDSLDVGELKKYLIPALIAASPLIGAVVSGAVVGVTGLGGIAGGIASAAHDPRVKQAASVFMAQIGQEFFSGGSAFVVPIEQGLDILAADFKSLDLGDAFAKAAPSVTVLAHGIGDFAKNLMPGFNRVLDDSGPIIRILAEGLAGTGTALSQFLLKIASSPGTLEGLRAAFDLLNRSISGLGGALRTLGDLFDLGDKLAPVVDQVDSLVPGLDQAKWVIDHFGEGVHVLDGEVNSLGKHTASLLHQVERTGPTVKPALDSYEALTKGMELASVAAARQAQTMRDLATAIDSTLQTTLDLDEADINMQQSMADLSQTVQDNGKHWNDNTQAAVNNKRAIDDAIQAAMNKRDAEIKASDGSAAAIKKINDEYNNTIKEIDAIATKLGAAPKSISTKYTIVVSVVGAEIAQGKLDDLNHQHYGTGSGRAAGGSVLGGRTYTVAEQRTEMFTAGPMRWTAPADGFVTPMGGAAGHTAPTTAGGTIGITISAGPGMPAELLNQLRFVVDKQFGGDAQLALSRRRS